jgi:predicted amidohydrolase YtcJ
MSIDRSFRGDDLPRRRTLADVYADATKLLLRGAQIADSVYADVRVADDRIVEIGTGLRASEELVIECGGAALLPGLHDHHCHLLATAGAMGSVECGPPTVRSVEQLGAALRSAVPHHGWVRGVGYDESVAGDLSGDLLTQLGPSVPTRVQHRSGALWIVNRAGAEVLRLDDMEFDGVERDDRGRPTGRLWRLDAWLRGRLGTGEIPDLSAVSHEFAVVGVTGVTDATPRLDEAAIAALQSPNLRQRVLMLGGPSAHPLSGPEKIVVPDHELPNFDDLADRIRMARPRAVAVHCVTRISLLLVLAVLDEVGVVHGDRIEHASVVVPEAARRLAALGLTVVTQPSFLSRRGDDYLDRVDADDLPFLWPFASLIAAGVRVGCSSDAPYGPAQPEVRGRGCCKSAGSIGADYRSERTG